MSILSSPHTVGAPNGALLFWGFIDNTTTYTSVTFANSSGTDFFGFDDLVIGSLAQVRPVPEPATLALFGRGLAGMGFIRWRKAA